MIEVANPPKCRYCENPMRLILTDTYSHFHCMRCGSSSRVVFRWKDEADMDLVNRAIEAGNAPIPARMLSKEEALEIANAPSIERDPVYVQWKPGAVSGAHEHWMCTDCYDSSFLLLSGIAVNALYGRTFVWWDRRPSVEQKMGVKWSD